MRCCLRQKKGRPLIDPFLDGMLIHNVDVRSGDDQREIDRRIQIYQKRAMKAMRMLRVGLTPASIFEGFERVRREDT